MRKTMFLALGTVSLISLLSLADAQAQPVRRWDRNVTAGELGRDRGQARDDVRDLIRFQRTLQAFDAAMARQDAGGVRGALQSFVAQGRAEVAEQRRETAQAFNEAGRSGREAWRDGGRRDARDARDDRRDARRERQELIQEETLLAELERTAAAEVAFGPRGRILQRARQVMSEFIRLAEVEIRRNHQEIREDRRELREDQRNLRRTRGF